MLHLNSGMRSAEQTPCRIALCRARHSPPQTPATVERAKCLQRLVRMVASPRTVALTRSEKSPMARCRINLIVVPFRPVKARGSDTPLQSGPGGAGQGPPLCSVAAQHFEH
jgi:hypothetical protein